jgi:hypothetical protein
MIAAAVASARNAELKKQPAGSVDPSGTECGTCHQRNYCENCHTTGAFKIDHDQMLYSHAGDRLWAARPAPTATSRSSAPPATRTADVPAAKTNGR